MGIPSRDPASGSPCPSPRKTITVEDATGPPVMCLHCGRRLAVPLIGEAGIHVSPTFCSDACAVTFALDRVANSLYTQCDFCGGWTDEYGDCPLCDQIFMPSVAELADEILADEAARKAVEHDA